MENKNKGNSIKDTVKVGALVLLDTRTKDGKDYIAKDQAGRPIRVCVSKSLSLGLNMSKGENVIASHLLDALNRTINANKFMGNPNPPVLKVCIDAKNNTFIEGRMAEWAHDDDTSCIVFALPGQITETGLKEMKPSTIQKLKTGEITEDEAITELRREMRSNKMSELLEKTDGDTEILGVKMPNTYGPESLEAIAKVMTKLPTEMVTQLLGATKGMLLMAINHKDEGAQRKAEETIEVIEAELKRRKDESK